MPVAARRIAGALGRTLLALATGIASGAVLVTGYIYLSQDDALVFEGLFVVSLYYGLAIAAFCVPLWLMLAKLGQDGAPAAAALGFLATGTFLLLTDAAGGHVRIELMRYTFAPYAACGAVAAVVTWWVGRRLRPG
jgi:hypothetical protein